MAVNSVTATTDLASKVVQQTKPLTQAQQTNAANPADQTNQANKAQEQQAKQTQAPRPIVNSQGQTIGKNISLTA